MTIKNKILSLRQSLNNSVARLRKNEDGIAAIEFAFTVPMFIALYYGLAESAHAISMDKRISHAAYVAGDLATQVETINSSDMTDIMYAALRIAGVEDSSKIKMEIDSYIDDGTGNPLSIGSAKLNSGASATLGAPSVAKIDNTIMTSDSGIVRVRIAYTYSPLKLRFMKTDINLSDGFLFKPRKSTSLTLLGTVGTQQTCSSSGMSNVSCL